MEKNIKRFSLVFSIFVVVALSFWTWAPLLHAGFFPVHDNTQIARVFEMGKSLKDGMLPVRWVSDLGYGYGYPIFTFYAPLAYYVGGMMTFFINALMATKFMMGLGIIFSGITMFFLARKLFPSSAAFVASVLYLYAPYHAVDVYVRGDIAEFWAYAWVPLVFLGAVYLYQKMRWRGIIVGGVGLAGIILSHNLTAMMITPFLVLLLAILVIKKHIHLLDALYLVLLGIGLSAWYALPVFAEMKYTNVLSQIGGGADFHDHFVCLSQLWQSPWGYGGSAKGCIDGFSFMMGKMNILLSLVALGGIAVLWKKEQKIRWVFALTLLGLLSAIFFMLPQSQFLWDFFKPMAFFQYPWRFLLLASFFSSLLGGGAIYLFVKRVSVSFGWGIAILIILVTLIVSKKYFIPQQFSLQSSDYYTSRSMLTWTTSKISSEYMPKNFAKPLAQQDVPTGIVRLPSSEVHILTEKTQQKSYAIELPAFKTVSLALAYFPAWQALLDGKSIPLRPDSKGMSINLPQGHHTLTLTYQQTPIEQAADALSLGSFAVLLLVIIKQHYGKKTS